MTGKVISFLAKLWSVKATSLEVMMRKPPDVIMIITHGLTKDGRLTEGSAAVTSRAAELGKAFPHAAIVFGAVAFAAKSDMPDRSERERILKMALLEKQGSKNRVVYAGPTLTTIVEAEMFRDALHANGVDPHHIVVVDGPAHSRSARYIWGNVFPSARISMSIIAPQDEVADQLIVFARSPTLWFCANVARFMALRAFGINVARRFVEPASY